jgi:hypothetical protein
MSGPARVRARAWTPVGAIAAGCAVALSAGLLGAGAATDEVLFLFLLALMAGHSLSASP